MPLKLMIQSNHRILTLHLSNRKTKQILTGPMTIRSLLKSKILRMMVVLLPGLCKCANQKLITHFCKSGIVRMMAVRLLPKIKKMSLSKTMNILTAIQKWRSKAKQKEGEIREELSIKRRKHSLSIPQILFLLLTATSKHCNLQFFKSK